MKSLTPSTMRCIYCGGNVGRHKGDHLIPAALGEFRKAPHFHRVCKYCNHSFSEFEKHALHSGAIAHPRAILKPPDRRGTRITSPRDRTEYGIERGDHTEPVRPLYDEYRTHAPEDSFVVKDKEGRQYSLRLTPEMTRDSIQRWLEKNGIDLQIAWVHCSASNFDFFFNMTRSLPGISYAKVLPDTPEGTHQIEIRMSYQMDEKHFRLIAKIAFHYYLCFTKRFVRGDEPQFRLIREFIHNGGEGP